MGFSPGSGSGGSGSIAGSSDVALSSVQDDQVLGYDSAAAKWQNQNGSSPNLNNLPAGSTITVQKSSGSWPSRPTSRGDIVVMWKGPNPSPSIVSSGTSGMRDDVDVRLVTQ